MRTTSDRGLKFIMDEEGYRNEAYPDPAHGWATPTIGVGHTGPEVHQGLVWTDEQVMSALRQDIKEREDCIGLYVTVPLTQNQYDALVSFIFNIGVGAFKTSTMRRLLNAGDYIGASAQFPRWNIPSMLIPRRRRERALFDTP